MLLKTGNQFLDIFEKIEIKINDACLSNKLSLNEFSKLTMLHTTNDESHMVYAFFNKKINLVKITNFVYNFNDYDDEFMKLDELSIINNESFVLKTIGYFKQNRFKYSLLDKLELLLSNHDGLYFVLNDSNFFMQISLIDKLINLYNEIDYKKNVMEKSRIKFNDQLKFINFKFRNCYVNLIQDKIIYTVGTSLLNLNLNIFESKNLQRRKTTLTIFSEYFVAFKSNRKHIR